MCIRDRDQASVEISQEMSGVEDRIGELQGKCLSEAGLVESLMMLGQGRNLPDSEAGNLDIRIERLLVNIRLKARTPEHGGSRASGETCVNQTMIGSDLIQIGSARRSRIRTCAIIDLSLIHI